MNRLVDDILVSVAALGIIVAARHLMGTRIMFWAWLMLGVGLFILIFGHRILDGQPSRIKTFAIVTVGATLLLAGLESVMDNYPDLWWAFGLGGILLFNVHNYIAERF